MAIYVGQPLATGVDPSLVPLTSPLPPSLLPPLAMGLLIAGLVTSALFYVREQIGGRRVSMAEEAALAGAAAACLGFGTLFLLLWCGVYVG
ncbi:hypothetical protein CHLNCDRAFT_141519 [Chlorella variabilis]|uniref:Dolichyl-diphosphooligosaccharide-protein glycosyltransferase subunit OST5 n=1 Tax=Chlorella variabilis TaxID=554065 RepID=E1ZT13_CHLVA|nr:hypothetical protein CHLNCDRAFT_141519 [Chlorella variabilis]EFN50999.1 hypothetical protein CHLNCDRAFT_141519 [Chlorella variabilis]|eukprot:XP_005843101.1 hypothetical protein CHLNCDRAFT_141519 [Chlorella variabilis]